jgi:hypothetical protein
MPGIHRSLCWAWLVLPLALTGCHKRSVEAQNATPEAVASKIAASGIKPRAGRWEATTQLDKIEVPGMTPQMRAAMEKGMAQKNSFASCLTQAQADKPEAGFFQSKDNRCKFDNFSMSGGKIDAKMRCNEADGQHTMTMAGTYTPESYNIHMDMNGKEGGQAVSMSLSTKANRVGECRGNENS